MSIGIIKPKFIVLLDLVNLKICSVCMLRALSFYLTRTGRFSFYKFDKLFNFWLTKNL